MHTYTAPGLYRAQVTILDVDGVPFIRHVPVAVGCTGGDLTPWSGSEVGEPRLPGCATYQEGCIELTGWGPGIDRTHDDLHFVYREITGDFSAIARVREIEWATSDKAGIMARASLDPESPFAFSAAWNHRSSGITGRIECRKSSGGTVSGRRRSVSEPWQPPNLWLRLDREGETFTGHWSVDGQNWNEIDSGDSGLSGAPDSMLVGVTVSPDADSSIQATFCDVSISQGPSTFHRADTNDDGTIDVTDAVSLLGFLFGGGEDTGCKETQDFDNDGRVILTDAVGILLYLFSGGPAPAAPGATTEDCGSDPDAPDAPGDLGCRSYWSC